MAGRTREALVSKRIGMESWSWVQDAACRGADTSKFFKGTNWEADHVTSETLAFCNSCSAKEECLDFAIATGVTGVWAGTNWRDRQRIKRTRQKSSWRERQAGVA